MYPQNKPDKQDVYGTDRTIARNANGPESTASFEQ